ncbi:hypothetical protein [Mangrovicoccus sp. HB161399]|uniref:hypothetical protein n=1 Tax=Mangrovicoccus sp. HB161399 TaxID=2720392 RepID=UPI001558179A|nr:hypothetical protein [Mangrovicoccus sp. HB161399]
MKNAARFKGSELRDEVSTREQFCGMQESDRKEPETRPEADLPHEHLDHGRQRPTRAISSLREFERFLREDGGFSRSEAKRIAANGFLSEDSAQDDVAQLMRCDLELQDALQVLKHAAAEIRENLRG